MSPTATPEVRVLGPGDESALVDFLLERLDTSLFLLSNAEAAGLYDQGRPLQGTYAAMFEGGAMTAVAGHFWNGMVIVQGDEASVGDAARVAVGRSGRALTGLMGPLAPVERARLALGAETRRTKKAEPEILYGLDLDRLRVPVLLDAPGVVCRPPNEDEIAGVLLDWRVEFSVETLGEERTPALRASSRESLGRLGPRGRVLLRDGSPVSYATLNATTHGVAQVGSVYTPPGLRGRGYARAVVAGCLRAARGERIRRSVLFTARTNIAAQRAYRALGYEAVGDFGLVVFEEATARP
jgi:ribosomal protein S18 acetylase RimI-like enzyme